MHTHTCEYGHIHVHAYTHTHTHTYLHARTDLEEKNVQWLQHMTILVDKITHETELRNGPLAFTVTMWEGICSLSLWLACKIDPPCLFNLACSSPVFCTAAHSPSLPSPLRFSLTRHVSLHVCGSRLGMQSLSTCSWCLAARGTNRKQNRMHVEVLLKADQRLLMAELEKKVPFGDVMETCSMKHWQTCQRLRIQYSHRKWSLLSK